MRILVVGAGAIGGYFGARLAAAGRDVTFLVRRRRAEQLARSGLNVKSQFGDLHIARPQCVLAEDLKEPFDLILLSCKSYDLDSCIADIAPAMAAGSLVLPLLNGMRHMEALDLRFGAARVLGGLARISTALDADGTIHHFQHFRTVLFGSRREGDGARLKTLTQLLNVPGFEAVESGRIEHDMWEKWCFIAAAASATSFMRATVGDIMSAGMVAVPTELLSECAAIAAQNGFVPEEAGLKAGLAVLTTPGSDFTASMFRDIENGGRIEADHIVGDLLARVRQEKPLPLLRAAYAHLKCYEARRARESGG